MTRSPNNAPQTAPPLLSIITVTLNNAGGLARTLESVAGQTMQDFEVIVIDGGSSDGTLKLVEDHKNIITDWVSEPDQGIYDAMNKGLSLARGSFVNFLNAGDTYFDNKTLDHVLNQVTQDQVDMIYGNILVMEDSERESYLQKAMEFNKPNLMRFGTGVLCHQALFIRRELAPLYNTEWRFKAELNWYFDIIEKNRLLQIKHLDMPLVRYSLGGFGQMNFRANQAEWLRLVKKRYGTAVLIKYMIPVRLILKLPYRYKWIRRILHR